MYKPKILVTGASGQLGKSIKDVAADYPQFEFIFLSRLDLAIEEPAAVASFFETNRPEFCINCAAFTAVDKAETEKENAFLINAEAVRELSQTCKNYNTKFIHISTDYVFNGQSAVPYKEDAQVDPVNIYGASKAKGEQLAMTLNVETIVIRTSWVYSEHGSNFVKTMMRLMKEKKELNIVNDQLGSPTYAFDLALAIIRIIDSKRWMPGTYHYCNKGNISWYGFATTIKEMTGSHCILHPVATAAYPTPAKRPAFSLLDTSKISNEYAVNIPAWEVSLKLCIQKIQNS